MIAATSARHHRFQASFFPASPARPHLFPSFPGASWTDERHKRPGDGCATSSCLDQMLSVRLRKRCVAETKQKASSGEVLVLKSGLSCDRVLE